MCNWWKKGWRGGRPPRSLNLSHLNFCLETEVMKKMLDDRFENRVASDLPMKKYMVNWRNSCCFWYNLSSRIVAVRIRGTGFWREWCKFYHWRKLLKNRKVSNIVSGDECTNRRLTKRMKKRMTNFTFFSAFKRGCLFWPKCTTSQSHVRLLPLWSSSPFLEPFVSFHF